MDYEVYLRREVFEFLRAQRPAERARLWDIFLELGRNPFRLGDFAERDSSDREIQALLYRHYAIFYWSDHSVKEVKIVEIQSADR